MRIGIFDSGLGGLVIAKAIFKKLPAYDYIYVGDTKRLPYGNRSAPDVYEMTRQAVNFLFARDCRLVVLACNTASALALRQLQRKYLPKHWPDRRILGVVIPTLEEADGNHRHKTIGVIATAATVKSHIYKKELMKIDPRAKIYEQAAPKLVPLIEQNSLQKAKKPLQLYLKPLSEQGIEALILGCTHYPILMKSIKQIVGPKVKVVSQAEFLPGKLAGYLKRHPEINKTLDRNRRQQFYVTKLNKNFGAVAERLFGKKLKIDVVNISGS